MFALLPQSMLIKWKKYGNDRLTVLALFEENPGFAVELQNYLHVLDEDTQALLTLPNKRARRE